MRRILVAAAFLLAAIPAAYAACDDLVTSEVGDVDVAKVTAAARQVVGKGGAEVRVRVFKTLGGVRNIGELEARFEKECSWQYNGKRNSNLLFVPFSVEKGDIMVASGGAINSRLTETMATSAITTIMVPNFQDYRKGKKDALTTGLVGMLGSFAVTLSKPLGGGGNTTIVNNEASDGSMLWKAILAIGIVVIVVLGVVFMLNKREDSSTAKGVQQKARGAYADCVSRIQTISNPKFVSEREFSIGAVEGILPAKTITQLRANLDKISDYAGSARSALTRFLPDQEKDPNPNGLSAAAYASNESACVDMVVHFVEPAEKLAEEIDTAIKQALSTSKVA